MEIKQVLLIRTDLNMGKGKAVAQACHAAVKAAIMAMQARLDTDNGTDVKADTDGMSKFDISNIEIQWGIWYREWDQHLYKKIALKVDESELVALATKAICDFLPVFVVRDAGLTQLDPNTITACAIGPAPADRIDSLVKHLKLY